MGTVTHISEDLARIKPTDPLRLAKPTDPLRLAKREEHVPYTILIHRRPINMQDVRIRR